MWPRIHSPKKEKNKQKYVRYLEVKSAMQCCRFHLIVWSNSNHNITPNLSMRNRFNIVTEMTKKLYCKMHDYIYFWNIFHKNFKSWSYSQRELLRFMFPNLFSSSFTVTLTPYFQALAHRTNSFIHQKVKNWISSGTAFGFPDLSKNPLSSVLDFKKGHMFILL